jgi:hypothetical protein
MIDDFRLLTMLTVEHPRQSAIRDRQSSIINHQCLPGCRPGPLIRRNTLKADYDYD